MSSLEMLNTSGDLTHKTLEEELVQSPGEAAWEEDETVPAGWSHRTVPRSRKVLVRDPTGRKFDGRRKAVLHLMERNQDLHLISVLSAGLEVEGWRSDESLPPGWRCRMTLKSKDYLNEKFELFTSNLKALEFARKHYDEQTVKTFKTMIQNFSKRKY